MLLTPETQDFLSTVTGHTWDTCFLYDGCVLGEYVVVEYACELWVFDPIYLGC